MTPKGAWSGRTVSVSLHFNGHFPHGTGLANVRMSPFLILLELRVMEVLVTTGAVRHAKLQCHHDRTNTRVILKFGGLEPYSTVKL